MNYHVSTKDYCLFSDLSYFLYDWLQVWVLSSEKIGVGLPVVITIIILLFSM